jgi:hypothetical protein
MHYRSSAQTDVKLVYFTSIFIRGYIGAHIYQGSFNADGFEDFVIDIVIPQC